MRMCVLLTPQAPRARMQQRILLEVGLAVGYVHSLIFVVLSHLQVKGIIMIW